MEIVLELDSRLSHIGPPEYTEDDRSKYEEEERKPKSYENTPEYETDHICEILYDFYRSRRGICIYLSEVLMFGIDTIIDIEKLVLSCRHSTSISETIYESDTEYEYRIRLRSESQYSHEYQRYPRERESDHSDSFHPDFLSEFAREFLEHDTRNSYYSKQDIAPSIFDTIEKCQKKTRSKCIPKSKNKYQANRPNKADIRWLMGEYIPYDTKFFFTRSSHISPRYLFFSSFFFAFWLDHEVFHFLYHFLYVGFCYGFYEILFHMLFIPPLDGYAEAIDIFEGY